MPRTLQSLLTLAAIIALALPFESAWSALPPPDDRNPAPIRRATPAPARGTPAAEGAPAQPAAAAPASARVPILMYHYVSDPAVTADRLRRDLSVSPAAFAEQLRFLHENGYSTISLDALHAHLSRGQALPPKAVVLTFDDGHIDHYDTVFPLLKQYGMTATFFVVADYATFSYTNPTYMSWEQIREMSEAGMSIESHGRTHRELRNRSFQFLVWEVLGPIEQIEAYTGKRPRFFCYPVGHHDPAVIRMLKSVQTLAAVTTEHGAEHSLANAFTWKRLRMRNTTTIAQLRSMLELAQ